MTSTLEYRAQLLGAWSTGNSKSISLSKVLVRLCRVVVAVLQGKIERANSSIGGALLNWDSGTQMSSRKWFLHESRCVHANKLPKIGLAKYQVEQSLQRFEERYVNDSWVCLLFVDGISVVPRRVFASGGQKTCAVPPQFVSAPPKYFEYFKRHLNNARLFRCIRVATSSKR